ncbi:MAG: hypothetical protein O2783_03905 [Chloroflexi bacterium]|nr:hypothetical protein [Chloroflexota bacterium]
MVRPKGINRGFTKLAVSMLRDDPHRAWTGEELAAEALRRDVTLSVAKNPIASLAHTFYKQVGNNILPEVEVVGSYPKRFRWRHQSAGGGSGSSEPPSTLSIPPSDATEYFTVTVGEAQFRAPATVENLTTGIGILQRFKEKLTP